MFMHGNNFNSLVTAEVMTIGTTMVPTRSSSKQIYILHNTCH